MKINRQNFLKISGLSSLGMMFGIRETASARPYRQPASSGWNMHGYAAPALDTVRMGFIGIGERGRGNVHRYAAIEGVEIKALCDTVPERVSACINDLRAHFPSHSPQAVTGGAEAWKQVCERGDIDLVCISTPWNTHAAMSVYSMEHDKHVYVDLPVGSTVEECWQVVETSENTRKHVYMDCVNGHSPTPGVILNMVRSGLFGDIIHGEGHYAHDRVSNTQSRWVRNPEKAFWFGFRPWRLQENVNRNGNLYPGHGLAPISQMMDLNYGDQMDYMVSISSNDFTMAEKMRELAEMDEYYKPYVGLRFRGNMNTTIIRTHRGRTLMLQHDISSPGIGQRFDLIRGNKGMYRANPHRIATIENGTIDGEQVSDLFKQYTPKLSRVFNEKLENSSRINVRGYSRVAASDWRLIDCLRNGLPIEVDVYDGALWSVITPLSEWSVAREGSSIKVPDFTRGKWRTNARGMDLTLARGGNTNLL